MTGGLYDRPILRLDPGAHTAAIRRLDVDAEGRWAVTGSYDRTVRVWSVESGALERTIPIPIGPGNVGRIDAVAISPDGKTIAAGGWTAPSPPAWIYLFDCSSGRLRHRIGGVSEVVSHLAFSPDGNALLATLSGWLGIHLFDPAAGQEIARDAN